jgi:hypothetical protein
VLGVLTVNVAWVGVTVVTSPQQELVCVEDVKVTSVE